MFEGELEKELKGNPTISHWLKSQLQVIGQRDVNDSIGDVELLLMVLKQRQEKIIDHYS